MHTLSVPYGFNDRINDRPLRFPAVCVWPWDAPNPVPLPLPFLRPRVACPPSRPDALEPSSQTYPATHPHGSVPVPSDCPAFPFCVGTVLSVPRACAFLPANDDGTRYGSVWSHASGSPRMKKVAVSPAHTKRARAGKTT